MMRDKVNVLYYPDMQVSQTTLKKCILFFDEIHFMDRPAFTIGNFGLIGAQSPLRAAEQSFREDAGVPIKEKCLIRLKSPAGAQRVIALMGETRNLFAVAVGRYTHSASHRRDQFQKAKEIWSSAATEVLCA